MKTVFKGQGSHMNQLRIACERRTCKQKLTTSYWFTHVYNVNFSLNAQHLKWLPSRHLTQFKLNGYHNCRIVRFNCLLAKMACAEHCFDIAFTHMYIHSKLL